MSSSIHGENLLLDYNPYPGNKKKNKLIAIFKEKARSALAAFSCGTSLLVELEFEALVFAEERIPESPQENPRSKATNYKKPQPTFGTAYCTATFVGGERSHNCAFPAPLKS